MDRRNYKGRAIVLSSKNFSEADKIFVLYTDNLGKMSVISKGVRKLNSKKRGSLEVFNNIKFQAVKSHSMPILTEVEVINDFGNIRKSLKKISVAYYLMEVVSKITREDEVNYKVFQVLEKYLEKLSRTVKLKALRHEFTKEIVVLMGFWPQGEELNEPDKLLEEVLERKLGSVRVGKKISL